MALQAERTFGPHLMLDMRGCDPDKLWDDRLVFDVLHQLPDEIGMTRITQPYVFPYSGVEPADAGITGVAIIAESHISIHTFPLKRFAFTDVFSCKPFDCEKARECLVKKFSAEHHEHWLIDRGERFPRGADSPRVRLKCDCCCKLFDGTDDGCCRSSLTGRYYWICPYCGSPA
jgi:S-adenosylmethionine decarboxylase